MTEEAEEHEEAAEDVEREQHAEWLRIQFMS
jgi:hypothetical protein